MSNISIEQQPSVKEVYGKEKDKATKALLTVLADFSRGFWTYAEETSESSTKPFEGIL